MTGQELFDRTWQLLNPVPGEKFEVVAAPVPQCADIARLDKGLGLPAPQLPEWASVETRAALLWERGVTGKLPLLAIVSTSAVAWGINTAGQVVQVDDDVVTPLERPLAESYGEQVAKLLERLVEHERLHPTLRKSTCN